MKFGATLGCLLFYISACENKSGSKVASADDRETIGTTSSMDKALLDSATSVISEKKHPRLIWTKNLSARLRNEKANNPIVEILASSVQEKSGDWLDNPTELALIRKKLGKFKASSALNRARVCVDAITVLGSSYRLHPESQRHIKYGERVKTELRAFSNYIIDGFNDSTEVAKFKGGKNYLLAMGEAGVCLGLGYDWTFELLSFDEMTLVKRALRLILDQTVEAHSKDFMTTKPSSTSVVDTVEAQGKDAMTTKPSNKSISNWNPVANSGRAVAALALLESDNTQVDQQFYQDVLNDSLESLHLFLSSLSFSGMYHEGPTYWNYAFWHLSVFAEAYKTAAGEYPSPVIAERQRLIKAAAFQRDLVSTSSDFMRNGSGSLLMFNFADSYVEDMPSLSAMAWLSGFSNDGETLSWIRKFVQKPGFKSLVWLDKVRKNALTLAMWPMTGLLENQAPSSPDVVYVDKDQGSLSVMRSRFPDSSLYLAVKSSKPSMNHAHMDSGSFVLDIEGRRWISDLGSGEYSNEGYFMGEDKLDGKRWQYFQANNLSHSTLNINNKGQVPNQVPYVVTSQSVATASTITIDLTPAYSDRLSSFTRTFLVNYDTHTVLIHDKLTGLKTGAKVEWHAVHCAGEEHASEGLDFNPVSLILGTDGLSKSLTLGKDLYQESYMVVSADEASGASFSVVPANPNILQNGINRVRRSSNESEVTNNGCYLLRLKVPSEEISPDGSLQLRVTLRHVMAK